MRVTGTSPDGWMPIDLEQVALAIQALNRSTSTVATRPESQQARAQRPAVPRQEQQAPD